MSAESTPANVPASQSHASLPYPPSWVDRLTEGVDRLPGPAWVAYLLAAAALVLLHAAAKWYDGIYPLGTFYPIHVATVVTGVYYPALIHYTDAAARRAMAKFQPALDPHQPGSAELTYRLATSPPREVWLATGVGLIYGAIIVVGTARGLFLASLAPAFNGPVSFWADGFVGFLVSVMFVLTIYHTVRQLRMIHRIYTRYTRIDLFNLAPLYALSQLAASTASCRTSSW